jgi:hypothetical protein
MAPFGAAAGISASLRLRLCYAPIPAILRTPPPGTQARVFIGVFATGDPPNDPSTGLRLPWGFRWGPDGNLYVASNLNNQVRRYNGTTGVFIDVFLAGSFPSGGDDPIVNPVDLAFGPDGDLFVTNSFGFGPVQRFDGLSGAFIDTVAPDGFGLQFGPDGNLYLSRGDRVERYNGLTGAFIDVFASGGGLDGASFLIFRTVPEPSTLWLLSAAVVGLFAVSRRVAPARSASHHRSSDC